MGTDSPYNPSIRVHQSTSGHGLADLSFDSPSSMVEGGSTNIWDSFEYPTHLSPHTLQHQNPSRGYRTHKRISSDSSVASVGPDSPFTHTLAYPQIVDSDSASVASAQFDSFDSGYPSSNQYSKSSYAPQTSQNHDSFLAPAFQDFNPATGDAQSYQAVQAAMRQALMEQQRANSIQNQTHSSRGSFAEEYNELSRLPSGQRNSITKLNRTMSDIYQDELYNPSMTTSVPSQQPPRQYIPPENHLSPQKRVLSDLLQAAHNGHITARSASPAANLPRERSPYAPESEFATERFSHSTPNSPARLSSAAQIREQQKAESDARVLAEHQSRPSDFVAQQTISPKEVALDYNEAEEAAKMPLFKQDKRENQVTSFASSGPNLSQSDVDDNTSERSYSNMAPRRQRPSNLVASTASGQSGSTFTFMPPSVPGSIQMPQQYPFISQLQRQSSSLRSTSDQAPEFPAQLTSMESSKSDTNHSENLTRPDFTSSAESTQRSPSSPGMQRPLDTTAATGSYTCTIDNCPARFDNVAKLNKHRREAHRASPPRPMAVTPTTSSTTPTSATTPSASSASVNRNQQAGPHKCLRINPSTGKPCNTVFSRSYDLTRHEDTIHSNRKQKSFAMEQDGASDYGSDFTPDEEQILQSLLQQTPINTAQYPDLSLKDIESDESPQGARVPRRYDLRQHLPRKDPTTIRKQKNYLPVEMADNSSGGPANFESPESRMGRDRHERSVSIEAPVEIPPVPAHNEEPDLRSPLERFRTKPKKTLSVTDLVSPSWCELQYWYTLTKHGKKKRTPAMRQGSAVHKTLEEEVHRTVAIDIQTREDAWGLRIWNVIQGLRTLRETGMTRELEVWGVFDGLVVNGVIDELSYTCPDRELEASELDSTSLPLPPPTLPADQKSLTDFLSPKGTQDLSQANF
ncbi:MAG: hypothetical protein Q9222_007031, partial [Ikaeria aurantiellina]